LTAPDSPAPYQVLARKYRPRTFADLIGQEAMVRTLRNAFEADRIAHAFVLTGVRGVGKTSTARIIAKGLNCTGPDGQGGPTIEPCGTCEACTAIAEGRHVDVLEMDAASRTGVGDIREIIDSVAYRAASARFKVYIVDEVHMLSTSAFNALLKTLEEPPAHVKFLFATTEIRKVPVTVLSRCQRFDLRRIEPETMIAHLAAIAEREGVALAPDALALVTRAAEGSVRDALSLLDQAIAHGGGEVSAEQVRAMLGLADRGRVLDLFERVMTGDARGALAELAAQYAAGADPMAVLRDLAEVTHWISVVKIAPESAEDPTVSPDERARGLAFAERLGMRSLTRAWQMLIKALEEVANAPNAMMAAEMALIRLTHVADLPTPEELVRRLSAAPSAPQAAPPPAPPAGPGTGAGTGAPVTAGARNGREHGGRERSGRGRAGGRPAPPGHGGHRPRPDGAAPGRARSAARTGGGARPRPPRALRRLRGHPRADPRSARHAAPRRGRGRRAPRALRPRPHRVRARRRRGARPRLPPRPAPAGLDRRALGRLGRRIGRGAHHRRAPRRRARRDDRPGDEPPAGAGRARGLPGSGDPRHPPARRRRTPAALAPGPGRRQL
jgi:DNA polymerase III subunit gamma/tau